MTRTFASRILNFLNFSQNFNFDNTESSKRGAIDKQKPYTQTSRWCCTIVMLLQNNDTNTSGRIYRLFVILSLCPVLLYEMHPAALICGLETIFPPLKTMQTVSFTSFIEFRLSSKYVFVRLARRLFNMPIKLKFIFSPFSNMFS